jgi:hypothetical protein
VRAVWIGLLRQAGIWLVLSPSVPESLSCHRWVTRDVIFKPRYRNRDEVKLLLIHQASLQIGLGGSIWVDVTHACTKLYFFPNIGTMRVQCYEILFV